MTYVTREMIDNWPGSHAFAAPTETPTGPTFTTWEVEAVAAYAKATAGTPDTLNDQCLDDNAFPDDWALDDKQHFIRSLFKLLGDWYEQLDSLYTGLDRHRRPPYEGPRFSPAAMEYLQRECTQRYRALHVVRREACRILLGTAGPRPDMEAAYLTFGDIPGVLIDGTVCAESR